MYALNRQSQKLSHVQIIGCNGNVWWMFSNGDRKMSQCIKGCSQGSTKQISKTLIHEDSSTVVSVSCRG